MQFGSPPPLSGAAEPALSLRDASVRMLLAACLLLQGFAWLTLEGYQLADSVEYMDRALMAVDGQGLQGSSSVRSFAFSLLFFPIFKLARELGVEDLRPLVFCARGLQMLLTLALVLAVARLGSSLADRRTGWVAGALVALNPVVLRYSVSPVADIAAALCLTLGAERLLLRSDFKRSLVGGLWLGLAFLASYKSLLPILILGLCFALRDRRRGVRMYLGMALGVMAAIAVQVALDRVVYGQWGVSLIGWYFANIQSRLVYVAYMLHERTGGAFSEQALRVAVRLYEGVVGQYGLDVDEGALESRMSQAPTWYLRELPSMVVWPLLVALVAGIVRIVRRPRWPEVTALAVVVVFAIVTSTKGHKSFRLWLPIAPFLALIGGLGWAWLHGGMRAARTRRAAAWLLLAAALPFCIRAHQDAKPRYFGAFWQAMGFVNEAVSPERPGMRAPRVGSTFHWAVFLRQVPHVELVRSPYPLDSWPRANTDPADTGAAERRTAIRAWVESLDWLIAHTALIRAQPSMLAMVNEVFTVEAVFYDHEVHAGMGPVCVLRRTHLPSQADRGLRFHRVREEGRARALVHRLQDRRPQRFERVQDDGSVESLTFLGWEVEPLPGTPGLFWSTYHWGTDTGLAAEYLVLDRTSAPDLRETFQNNHHPTGGAVPMRTWKPGQVISESYLMLARDDAFKADHPHPPIGGAYRRGDRLPISLWIGVVEEHNGEWTGTMRSEVPVDLVLAPRVFDATLELLSRLDYGAELDPALAAVAESFELDRDEIALLRERAVEGGRRWVRDGVLLSKDNLVEVGRTFLPVTADVRLPDDGRRIASEQMPPTPVRASTPVHDP